jgi:thioredoxin reductase (NADPH)
MGGAIMNTERVEDFPGFPDGIAGFELGPRLQEQVTNAGGAVEMGEATRVEQRGADWVVATGSDELVSSAVIVATGSGPRKLGVEREDEFEGKGLSRCASCDGPLFGGKLVAMVGGGDSALLETLELTGHDVRVVLIHPDEALRGQETYRRRVSESASVEIRHGSTLDAILGDGQVSGVRVRELASGESHDVPVDGLFVHVGRLPSTAWLDGVLALDTGGHIPTDIWMRTEAPGLFAAGDVRANAAGQAASAAGDGATAAVAAHRYLAERDR